MERVDGRVQRQCAKAQGALDRGPCTSEAWRGWRPGPGSSPRPHQLCSCGQILSALERQCLRIRSEVWGQKILNSELCNVQSYQCPSTITQVVGRSLLFLEHVFLGRQTPRITAEVSQEEGVGACRPSRSGPRRGWTPLGGNSAAPSPPPL